MEIKTAEIEERLYMFYELEFIAYLMKILHIYHFPSSM